MDNLWADLLLLLVIIQELRAAGVRMCRSKPVFLAACILNLCRMWVELARVLYLS